MRAICASILVLGVVKSRQGEKENRGGEDNEAWEGGAERRRDRGSGVRPRCGRCLPVSDPFGARSPRSL